MKELLDGLCGKDNWVAYCINLKRATQRRATFQAWADSINLPFTFFEATDKLNLTEDDYKLCDVWVNGTARCAGATACRLSHHRLSEHFLSAHPNVEYCFFLEDDAGFKQPQQDWNNFVNFVSDIKQYNLKWDLLHLGYHDTGFRRMEQIAPHVAHVHNTHVTHAMLMNRKMVENHLRILRHSNPKIFSLPVDWTCDLLRQYKVGVTLGPLQSVFHQVDTTISFIWD